MPTFEDVAAKIRSHNKVSKLDATSRYLMLTLTEKSSLVTNFNTPFGRYKYKRIPFGLITVQDEFQRKIEETFGNLKGVCVVADDILVSVKDEEHNENLRKVLEKATDVGSPNIPQFNVHAEEAVDIAIRTMLKPIESNTSLYLGLLEYWNTPIDGEASPAQPLMSRSLRSILPCTRQQLEPNNVPKTKSLKARTSQQERQKQNYDKASKDLIELKDNQPTWIKLSKEATHWTKGVVTSCGSPRSYFIQAENGRFCRRNRAHLKPRSNAKGDNAQQSSGFTGDKDLRAEIHPPVIQSSSPKNVALKTPYNCSTGEIFLDSPYRAPRTPTPPPEASSKSRNGEDYSRPYMTRTGRVVKTRKIMDI
ncbi:hypothetical protein QYM36_011547 [Artemia franciscana]|uniref:Reverse transcriptase domain-containing protein n=1 Tax=Artemia franciscana TaxID=6661 RepID=A0AA88HZL0_ARTSF|nr:hypothetical protein QYM36_011547 [Artemia franciscana]